jgi:hypothetical protein
VIQSKNIVVLYDSKVQEMGVLPHGSILREKHNFLQTNLVNLYSVVVPWQLWHTIAE